MVQAVLRTMQLSQLQFIDKVFDVTVVHVQQIFGCSLRDDSRDPTVTARRILAWTTLFTCPLCATTVAWWFRVQKTAMSLQLQCSDMVSGDF